MADAANLQLRRPKSMLILRAIWKKAVIRGKKMQTALHFMFPRRLQLLNVSLLMLLLLFSRQQKATPNRDYEIEKHEIIKLPLTPWCSNFCRDVDKLLP